MTGAPTKARISRWLAEARAAKKLTRRAVSVVLDVTERSIMRWEDEDDTPMPPADQFLQLVWLYGADLSALLPTKRTATADLQHGSVVVSTEPPPTRSVAEPDVPKKRKRA